MIPPSIPESFSNDVMPFEVQTTHFGTEYSIRCTVYQIKYLFLNGEINRMKMKKWPRLNKAREFEADIFSNGNTTHE